LRLRNTPQMIGFRRLNGGCAARRGLILLIRYRVPIGSATSTLVQRGTFINAHRTVLLVRPWWHAGRQRLSACSCLLLVWHIHRKIGMSGGLFTNQLLRETAVEIDPGRVERLQLMRGPISSIQCRSPYPTRASCSHGSPKYEFPGLSLPAAGWRRRRPTSQRSTSIPASVAIITRDQVRHAKPDPDLFLAAADRLGVPIERAIVVGDSI
jgi:hypothetical protein